MFKNEEEHELTIQQYIQEENLEVTQIYDYDREISSEVGTIYIFESPEINNAIILLDDGNVIYLWTTLDDLEITKLVESMGLK